MPKEITITWNELAITPSEKSLENLFTAWEWLIGKNCSPLLITAMGDAFLTKEDGKVHWLNVGEGTITKIAKGLDEFNKQLTRNDLVNEWFLVPLLGELIANNCELKSDELYSYKQAPIIGGKYELSNFEPTDISVHFHLNGQIHKQVKNLPNGTNVRIKTKG